MANFPRQLLDAFRLIRETIARAKRLNEQAQAHIPRFYSYSDDRTGWVCSCGAFSRVPAKFREAAEHQHLLHVESVE